MSELRFCAVTVAALVLSACEGGGLLADKPPATTLEPIPASSSSGANTQPDVTLVNTYWKLVELNGRPVRPGEGKELHMILKAGDQVSGYAGCNQFTGALVATDTILSMGPIAATRRMCEETVMEQEMAFLQALESARSYDINGEEMHVGDGQGEAAMRFVAVYMD